MDEVNRKEIRRVNTVKSLVSLKVIGIKNVGEE